MLKGQQKTETSKRTCEQAGELARERERGGGERERERERERE